MGFTIGAITGFQVGAGCVGKKAWGTYQEAEAAIGGLIKKRVARLEQGQIYPYFCGACMGWHHGHDKGQGKRERERERGVA